MPTTGHLVNYGFLPVTTLQKYEIMIKHASFYAKNCIKTAKLEKERKQFEVLKWHLKLHDVIYYLSPA